MQTQTLTEIYAVVTNHGEGYGWANAGDIEQTFDDAYNLFADAVHEGQETRAFHTTFDVETGAMESHREVTSDMMDEYRKICAERGLEVAA